MSLPEEKNPEAIAVAEDVKYAELKAAFEAKASANMEDMEFHDRCAAFVGELLKDFGRDELQKIKLYHVIGASGIRADVPITAFDVPGNLIQKFIEELP